MTGYLSALKLDNKPSAERRDDAWKAMKPFWENTAPGLIDAQMCQDYAKQRNVSGPTIRYELMMIPTAIRWAKGKPGVPDAAMITMWLPKVAERKVRHLSHKQFEKFYAAVKAPHARLYVLLGLYTMARPEAILSLEWKQVDFERGQINLNPDGRVQTAKKRPVVPMNAELSAALTEAYAGRQSNFVIERGGERIKSMKKAFQAATERCGMHVTPYKLRHTGAVWAAEAGVQMSALAQFMGHDDDRTTQKHYARFSPGYLQSVADAVQRKRA